MRYMWILGQDAESEGIQRLMEKNPWVEAIKASKRRQELEEIRKQNAQPIQRLFRAMEKIADEGEWMKEDVENAIQDGNTDLGFDASDFDILHKAVDDAKAVYLEVKKGEDEAC